MLDDLEGFHMPINYTEMAGFIASLPASLAAGAAAYISGSVRQINRGSWINISAINTLLAIEVFVNMRHRIDRAVSQWLESVGIYPERRPAQVVAVVLFILLVSILTRRIIKRSRTRWLAMGYGATIAFATVFVLESISLHQIDAIFYQQVGPIFLIGWIWLACGGTVTAAALIEARSSLSQRRFRPM